ncbi:MAG: hypothetical protein ACRDF4_01320, partial [Rhabdochlamydiaceae bacterium]
KLSYSALTKKKKTLTNGVHFTYQDYFNFKEVFMLAVGVVAPTIQSMTAKAREAHTYITSKDGLQSVRAQQALEELFFQTKQVLKAEFEGKALFPDTVYPVLRDLDEMVAFDGIQHETALQLTLSKVYRVCTDLTWFQCWRQLSRPVWTEARDNIIAHAKRMVQVAPATSLEEEFEYRSAEQGAKCLTPAESEWIPFVEAAQKMIIGAATTSPSDGIEGLKGLIKWYTKNLVEDWYLKTFEVRWLFAQVDTVALFQTETIHKAFTHYIEEGLDKGHKYAQGIVMLFMDMIRNQRAEQELKDLMVRGDTTLKGVVSMIQLESPGTLADFLTHPIGVWRAVAREADRFWKARHLATQFLKELASKPEFQTYRDESIQALRARFDHLTTANGKRYAKEKLENQQALIVLRSHVEELGKKEEALLQSYGVLTVEVSEPKTRARGDVQAELDRVSDEWDVVSVQKEQTETDLETKETELARITAIEATYEEERELLEQMIQEV